MQITINEKKVNALLHRVEVSGSIVFEGATPSNNDVAAWLAKELKKDLSLVVVKNIYTGFGSQEATFSAFVYDSASAKDKAEMKTKHLKKKLEEQKKKEEEERKAAAEAKKKAEEVKEEAAPVEEKEVAEPAKEEAPVENQKEAEDAPVEEKSEEPAKEGEA